MITGAIAAVVIIASAAAIGASLVGRPGGTSAGSSPGQVGGTAGSSTSNSGSADGGPNTNGSSVPLRPGALDPTPPPRLGPGTGRPPPRQHIALDPTIGDSLTQFNVYGYGWPPGVPLTVTLSHPGTESRTQVIYADRMNNFNYGINLNHEFFAHGLPPGDYRVMVAAAHGPVATAHFTVQRS